MTRSPLLLFSFLLISSLLFTSGCKNKCDGPNLNVNSEQLAIDIAIIDDYLTENNIEATEHPSGLRYTITRQGDGNSHNACDRIAIAYTGKTLDGTIFDESKDPVSFGLTSLITGWQIGLPLLKEGGRITLYIPSVYAYGASGAGSDIGPNESLIFEIYLLRVL